MVPLLAVAAALQASVVIQMRLLGGGPDLIFLIVLSWSVYATLENSIVLAFIGGIMLDLLSAAPLGSSTLGLIIIVFAISGLGQRVYQIGIVSLISMVLVGTLIQQFSVIIVLSLSGHPVAFGSDLLTIIVAMMFYNLVFIVPVYWVIRRIQRGLWRNIGSIR